MSPVDPTSKRVVIIGGGIAGLAAAHALEERIPGVRIRLVEAAPILGGTIRTETEGGFVLERGADSWVTTKPHATALARKVGVEADMMGTSKENHGVYVAWDERLHRVPDGVILGVPMRPTELATSSLFSAAGKARMAMEPFLGGRQWGDEDDESIGGFLERRLGRELTERLGAPLLGGIVSGEASDISLRATFPQLIDAEKSHGSLVLAFRARAKEAAAKASPAVASGSAPPYAGSMFLTLKGGLGDFIAAIARSLTRTTISTGTKVASVVHNSDQSYKVTLTGGESMVADAVIVAAPIGIARTLLSGLDTRVEKAFAPFEETVNASAFFGFRRDQIGRALDATGFLVPRVLERALVASTWVSSKWAGRAPADHVLIRGFLGGPQSPSLVAGDDATLAAALLDELRRWMPIEGSPVLTRVFRFRRPLLAVGHVTRIKALRDALSAHPNVEAIGSGYDGIGIPDCIRQAEETAVRIAASFARLAPRADVASAHA